MCQMMFILVTATELGNTVVGKHDAGFNDPTASENAALSLQTLDVGCKI